MHPITAHVDHVSAGESGMAGRLELALFFGHTYLFNNSVGVSNCVASVIFSFFFFFCLIEGRVLVWLYDGRIRMAPNLGMRPFPNQRDDQHEDLQDALVRTVCLVAYALHANTCHTAARSFRRITTSA